LQHLKLYFKLTRSFMMMLNCYLDNLRSITDSLTNRYDFWLLYQFVTFYILLCHLSLSLSLSLTHTHTQTHTHTHKRTRTCTPLSPYFHSLTLTPYESLSLSLSLSLLHTHTHAHMPVYSQNTSSYSNNMWHSRGVATVSQNNTWGGRGTTKVSRRDIFGLFWTISCCELYVAYKKSMTHGEGTKICHILFEWPLILCHCLSHIRNTCIRTQSLYYYISLNKKSTDLNHKKVWIQNKVIIELFLISFIHKLWFNFF